MDLVTSTDQNQNRENKRVAINLRPAVKLTRGVNSSKIILIHPRSLSQVTHR